MEFNVLDSDFNREVPYGTSMAFPSVWNAPDLCSSPSIMEQKVNSKPDEDGSSLDADEALSSSGLIRSHVAICEDPSIVISSRNSNVAVGLPVPALPVENRGNAMGVDVDISPDTGESFAMGKNKAAHQLRRNNPKSITRYVLTYYMQAIVSALNAKLAADEMDSIVLAHVENDEILASDCQMTSCTAWWENQTDFIVDVIVYVHHMKLTIQGHSGRLPETVGFVITLWFSHINNYVAEITRIVSLENYEEPCKVKLDDFLIPIFSFDGIEDAVEVMWETLIPGSLDDADKRRAYRLAEKLHLSIKKYRLADTTEDHILFLKDGCVMVQDPAEKGSDELPPPRKQPVEGLTIVLNTAIGSSEEFAYPIYAACLEFYYYFILYSFNGCVNTCLNDFPKCSISADEEKDVRDPLSIMHRVKARGTLALMIPLSDLVYRVDEAYKIAGDRDTSGYINHEGWRYDYAIRSVAEKLWVRPYRVRQRLIQLGRIKAKGAINYDPDLHHYFTPFSFSVPEEPRWRARRTSKERKPQPTFSIKRGSLFKLYCKDKDFQKLFSSGEYAFIDGLTCACDPNYIRFESGAYRMTASANADVAKCCLRYATEYNASTTNYIFDHSDFRKYSRVIERGRSISKRDFERHKMEVLSSLPQSFPDALRYLMQHRPEGPMNESMLSDFTGISDYVIHRYCNDPRMVYFLDEIIAICVALNLPPWASRALMDRANLSLLYTKVDIHLAFILDCLYLESVETVQAFLRSHKYRELLLERDDDEEKYAGLDCLS